MHTVSPFRLIGPVLLAGAAAVAGNGLSTHALAASGTAAASATPVHTLKLAKFGQVLVNAKGLTLYYYTPDKKGKPTCTSACAQTWPPLLVSKSLKVQNIHLPGKCATVAFPSGGRQLTYNGWPLYTYVGDTHPGATTGQKVQGIWFVATTKLKHA